MHIKMGLMNYVQEDDALERLARFIKDKGVKNLYIVTGSNAWQAVQDRLSQALHDEDVSFVLSFIGTEYPSWSMQANMRDDLSLTSQHPDGILGLGGGRALDAAKMLADAVMLPLFLAPTQAAQCASVAPLVAVYHSDASRNGDIITRAPILGTFVDMRVVAEAPPRYLAAGIADAFAKLAETYSAQMIDDQPTVRWNASVALAKEAAEIFFRSSQGALSGDKAALNDVVYAALYLTGLLSAMGGDRPSPSLGHNLYAAACDLYADVPRKALHGEIVGVGILLTAMVCDIPGMAADALRRLFEDTLKIPLTWNALGYPTSECDFDKVFTFITERKIPLPDKALSDIRAALKELFI